MFRILPHFPANDYGIFTAIVKETLRSTVALNSGAEKSDE
jgi:hypothetical protein